MQFKSEGMLVVLAGQPNCGKSSIFNMLTGARQTVANFPGVTVEKKSGRMKINNLEIEIVDLPGSYSMTSYTQEERITTDFLLTENPDLIVAVADASNLHRSLFFIFQLMEMNKPMALCLNMMDVAIRRGIIIDTDKLSAELGIPVIATVASKGVGKEDVKTLVTTLISENARQTNHRQIDYGPTLENTLETLSDKFSEYQSIRSFCSLRWLSLKIMENDPQALRIIAEHPGNGDQGESLASFVDKIRADFGLQAPKSPEKTIAGARYSEADKIAEKSIIQKPSSNTTLTDKIDSVLLSPTWAPVFLIMVLFALYESVMVFGTILADHAFPYFQLLQTFTAGLLPQNHDIIREGLLTSMIVNGLMGGVVAILYYTPLFLVLFAMLAILEDTGYMARIAFIMDRILRSFGLHGQSTLPLLLGGAVIGGCAVPATMATRAIKDDKAKLITILIMPLMNCMAKTPFYILIVGMFFAAYQGLILLLISVLGFGVALVVAKVLNRYMVSGETTPFIMELPAYHMPTIKGVMTRTIERTWLFVRKIVVIVAPIMVAVWFFITFPGIGLQKELSYDNQVIEQHSKLVESVGFENPFAKYLSGSSFESLIRFNDRYREAKRGASGDKQLRATQEEFKSENPDFFLIANKGIDVDGAKDKNAAAVAMALQKFEKSIKKISRERKKEIIETSWAGRLGQFLEPVSQLAGFGWQMNIAIISSFAAKESLVGTLGAIFSSQGADEKGLSASMAEQGGWTVWHALAILVFIAMFPPCLATLVMIRHETGSNRWTAFAGIYPIVLGFILAVCVFQFGQLI